MYTLSSSTKCNSEIYRDQKQREVIAIDSGYHLVLASPGCGKTDILAERVRCALGNGVNPDDMLCLTFTNRAARGMRERIAQISTEGADNLFVGNVHRYCSKFIFENGIIRQSSSIIDEDEAFSIVSTISDYVLEDQGSDPELGQVDFAARGRFAAVIQLQHLLQQYRFGHPKEVLLNNISDYTDNSRTERYFSPQMFAMLCRETGKEVSLKSLVDIYDSSGLLVKSNNFSNQAHRLLSLMNTAYLYEQYKKVNNLVDFDDLLIFSYTYLQEHSNDIKKFKWIQVDEVQDLNALQLAIISKISDQENVTLYLGDEQQAIFSFIGARLSTLQQLKERCKGNIHHLEKCYRSPKYLLDVFNRYATGVLGTDPDFLPVPNNYDQQGYGDLKIVYANTSVSSTDVLKKEIKSYRTGKTAVLVSSNKDADLISSHLTDLPHFKISGIDIFSSPQIKLILSHLNIVYNDINYLAWARLIYHFGIIKTFSSARDIVLSLKRYHLLPSDFIIYNDSCYVLEFLKTWNDRDIIVFDTETTGLDIYKDDIVQIAANKYRKGILIDSMNIILETGRQIPEFLGELKNPLCDEYANRAHVRRAEGLLKFLEFAKGNVIIGHNVEFDINILIQNCKRDSKVSEEYLSHSIMERFDTLKLARLIHPEIHNYKLGNLLLEFGLTGNNSHLADADIEATFQLAKYCAELIASKKNEIKMAIYDFKMLLSPLKPLYGPIYNRTLSDYYSKLLPESSPTVKAVEIAYEYFKEHGMKQLSKIEYIISFLKQQLVTDTNSHSLYEELSRHIMDLNTYKEADLCSSTVVKDNLFVATVHKAKGLEFDNVIVYGCVDGVYPFFATQYDPGQRMEDARKLYVAISRARKRLCLLVYNEKIVKTKMGQIYRFPVNPSPFLSDILKNNQFLTLSESMISKS